MRYLDVTANIPIGVMEEKKYNIQESVIAAGDMILLYTDGLTEAMNAGAELFGLKRVESAICGDGGMNADDKNRELPAFAGPQQLLDTMSHAVSEFVNGAEQSDDLTMLVIKYKG
jgi:serine phosphatase RsbU (regulator of sigma subunit)